MEVWVDKVDNYMGSDLYNNYLVYYRSLREVAKVNAVGASVKCSDLIPGGRKRIEN
jgi:hypothetical protein